MVLGIHWLRSLCPIIWDFSKLTMEFSLLSQRIVWTSLAPTESSWEDSNSFSKLHMSTQKGVGTSNVTFCSSATETTAE
jgi:hypothetical protein